MDRVAEKLGSMDSRYALFSLIDSRCSFLALSCALVTGVPGVVIKLLNNLITLAMWKDFKYRCRSRESPWPVRCPP